MEKTFFRGKEVNMLEAFVGSWLLYSVLGFVQYTRHYQKFSRWFTQEMVYLTCSGLNALVATVLSSYLLFFCGLYGETDIHLQHIEEELTQRWVSHVLYESVNGFILWELLFAAYFSSKAGKTAIDGILQSMIFHQVGMVGIWLTRFSGAGALICIWALWSEWTTVIYNFETYGFLYGWNTKYYYMFASVIGLRIVTFVFQRGLVFIYLFYLCVINFSFNVLYLIGFATFVVGLVMNLNFCWEQIGFGKGLLELVKSKSMITMYDV